MFPQELVTDVYCIIEAMIGADSGVQLLEPVSDGVPDMVPNPNLNKPCNLLCYVHAGLAPRT